MKEVTIYTDGACSGNPGPGGWGAILMYGDKSKEISGASENTTNNIMEITAVIEALKKQMSDFADRLEYEQAAAVRDQIQEIERTYGGK